jgi:methanogenesis imperfect marker protein 11
MKEKAPKWVMKYNEIIGIYDERAKKVMLIEDYGPENGFFIEAWRVYHFPRTSKLVENAYREGGKSIFILSCGKTKLKLIPSFSPIGISECQVKKDTIEIVYEGLGGGGVSAAYSRGMARGVLKSVVLRKGGGGKLGKGKIILPKYGFLLVGVDDTDSPEAGATYSLVHNISQSLHNGKTIRYVTHGNVQLYPYNPYKTSNCFSTVVGFIIKDKKDKEKIIETFKRELKKNTFSDQTAMVVYEGFSLPQPLVDIAYALKFHFFDDIEKMRELAKKNNVEIYEITGPRGIIGAMGSLGLYDNPEFASGLPEKYTHPFYL